MLISGLHHEACAEEEEGLSLSFGFFRCEEKVDGSVTLLQSHYEMLVSLGPNRMKEGHVALSRPSYKNRQTHQ